MFMTGTIKINLNLSLFKRDFDSDGAKIIIKCLHLHIGMITKNNIFTAMLLIEKLVRDHPSFFKISIAGSIYPSQPKGVATFGTRVSLVASGDLDKQTVYRIVNAIYTHRKFLKRSHPALSSFTMDSAQNKDTSIQRHPGADKFFSEHGM